MVLTNINVAVREQRGKGSSRRLRGQGIVPAVIYGKGSVEVPIQIPAKQLKEILKSETGRNTIINLQVNKASEKEAHTVMIRDIQQDPIKGMMLHADFYEISLDKKLNTEVPIVLVGEAEGTKAGGILQQNLRQIMVECLPTRIPESIEVDITNLQIGDKLTVEDLPISSEAKYITESDTMIVTVMAPRMAEEETEVSPEEAKEPNEEVVEGETDHQGEEA